MSLQVQEVQEPVRIGKVLDRLMISNFFFAIAFHFLSGYINLSSSRLI